MLLFLTQDTSMQAAEKLRDRLQCMGFESTLSQDEKRTVIAIISGMDQNTRADRFEALPHVERVTPFQDNFKLVGRTFRQNKTVIPLGDSTLGRDEFIVMAGPCSIESQEQIMAIAKQVAQSGATVLRGGAFKPRTSPYDFQGLGKEGLIFLRKAADAYGLRAVSEVMSTDDVALVEEHVDILQLGSRNMQNYALLKAVGKTKKPVLLKRGLSATYKEFLSAAEYIISSGNPNVILCERGIRTFETYTRNTLDVAAVPVLRELTHLPIILDPSHGVGLRHAVPAMARAALAVGADGLMVEVHTDPDASISDAAQTISTETFAEMMPTLRHIGTALGMRIKDPANKVATDAV